jgi:hypothetical protein
MFRGELVNNSARVDMSKVQNVVFTIVLVGIYFGAVAQVLASATLPDALPGLSDGMLALVAVSHSGYLIAKGTQTAPQVTETPHPEAGVGDPVG